MCHLSKGAGDILCAQGREEPQAPLSPELPHLHFTIFLIFSLPRFPQAREPRLGELIPAALGAWLSLQRGQGLFPRCPFQDPAAPAGTKLRQSGWDKTGEKPLFAHRGLHGGDCPAGIPEDKLLRGHSQRTPGESQSEERANIPRGLRVRSVPTLGGGEGGMGDHRGAAPGATPAVSPPSRPVPGACAGPCSPLRAHGIAGRGAVPPPAAAPRARLHAPVAAEPRAHGRQLRGEPRRGPGCEAAAEARGSPEAAARRAEHLRGTAGSPRARPRASLRPEAAAPGMVRPVRGGGAGTSPALRL